MTMRWGLWGFFFSFHKTTACHLHFPLPTAFNHSLVISASCCPLADPFRSHYSVCDLNKNTLYSVLSLSSCYPPSLLQVFQRLRLSNGDEGAALRELLRLRRVQCEGRGDWKHCPPQSPPLPPTLLWTNRKASPWRRLCDAVAFIGYEFPPSPSLQPHSHMLFLGKPSNLNAQGLGESSKPKTWALSLGWRSASLTLTVEGSPTYMKEVLWHWLVLSLENE